MHPHADVLETDVVTGERTDLGKQAGRALKALAEAEISHVVIGAMALAVRGLPRFTRDLDIVVMVEEAFPALRALEAAGYHSVAPVTEADGPEPMYVLEHEDGAEVDLLVAAAEPESSIVSEAESALVFGVSAPVASLEHLLLMYLYSNQPKHLGDFARIVTETEVDLARVERYLSEVHPEMLETLARRVDEARNPPAPPARPPRRNG